AVFGREFSTESSKASTGIIASDGDDATGQHSRLNRANPTLQPGNRTAMCGAISRDASPPTDHRCRTSDGSSFCADSGKSRAISQKPFGRSLSGTDSETRSVGRSQPTTAHYKQGDTYMRQLLVSSAQYILGHHGEDRDQRRHPQQIAAI